MGDWHHKSMSDNAQLLSDMLLKGGNYSGIYVLLVEISEIVRIHCGFFITF